MKSILYFLKNNFSFLIITASVFSMSIACQKVVEVPLNNSDPRLIIEGTITNNPGPYYVKLSTTGSYYDKGKTPSVSDASVVITDDVGNKDILTPVSDQPGIYQTNILQGVPGRTYHLRVDYNSKVYEADAYMHPLPAKSIKLDTILFVEKGFGRDEGYYLYFDIDLKKEPSTISYWRTFCYKNDSLYNGPNDYLMGYDEFLIGDIQNLELPYNFKLGDTVHLQMNSLDKRDFDYYNQLQQLLFNDGGLFSPPPMNPIGNISNQGLGLFRASAVFDNTFIVK